MMVTFVTVLRRHLLQERHYPLESIFALIAFYIVFLLIFLGGQRIGGPQFKEGPLSTLIAGYLVFLLVQQAFQSYTSRIRTETLTGTIEQLSMSRAGLSGILTVDMVVQIVIEMARISLLLALVVLTTGKRLSIDVVSLLPVTILMMVGVGGLGLAVGGMSLVFRRFQAVSGLIQFGFIGVLAAPIERFPFLRIVPVSQGFQLIEDISVRGASISQIATADIIWLVGDAVAYAAVGFVVFKWAETLARRRGLLGQY